MCTKYYYDDRIKEDGMGRTCSTYGEMRNALKILVGRPEVKRTVGKPQRRWKNNIKMNINEIRREDVDWAGLAHDRAR
jgi:hypothetical protein